MKTVKLIFIGNEFYIKSGTWMSSIYSEEGKRYDWGKVQVDLEAGNRVTIRPATSKELAVFQVELCNYLIEDYENRQGRSS